MKRNNLPVLLSLIFMLVTGCDNRASVPNDVIDPNVHYILPVVFQVLYKDRNDPLQYVQGVLDLPIRTIE